MGQLDPCSRATWPRPWRGLKEEADENLAVLGSGELIQTLMRHDLVDEYVLTIHPLVRDRGAACLRTTVLAPRCSSSSR